MLRRMPARLVVDAILSFALVSGVADPAAAQPVPPHRPASTVSERYDDPVGRSSGASQRSWQLA
jgi:hypothetical protein